MANDKEFNYGIKLTFSKGSDLTQQIAAVSKQLNDLGRGVGATTGGPLEKLDGQLQKLQARLQALQAQITTHKEAGLDPSDAVLKRDVDNANRAILHFTTNIKTQLGKLAYDVENAGKTMADDAAAGRVKVVGLGAQQTADRAVVDPRLGKNTPEQMLAHQQALERELRQDPMFKQKQREQSVLPEIFQDTQKLVEKTRELSDATQGVQEKNDKLLETIKQEAEATAESVTNLRLAQGQVVPATDRPLSPSLSRPGDQSEPTGGLVRPFKRERLGRAKYAAEQANIDDPNAEIERQMAPGALAAAEAERKRVEDEVTRSRLEQEASKPKVMFERPADFNGPTQIVAKDAVEAENKFAAAVQKRMDAQKSASAAADADATAVSKEAAATSGAAKAADELSSAKSTGFGVPPVGPATGSSADEVAAMDAKAAAQAKLNASSAETVAWAKKVEEAEARGATAVKAGRDVTEKAADSEDKRNKVKRVTVEVTGGEAIQNEKLAKKMEATLEGVLKDTRAANAKVKVNLEKQKSDKAASDQAAKDIADRQKQMEDFANVTDQILPENEEKLQRLVAELVDATQNGGNFEKSLGALQNRLAKLHQQGDTDLEALGTQLGLDADQAKRLATAVAAEEANTQFRQTFRQTRSFGSTFQSVSGIGSGFSRLGIPGVGEATAGVSGIAEVAENLPRLRASLVALPDTIKNLVTQIGTPTIGLAGGLVLLAALTNLVAQADHARAEAANALLDAQAKYFTLVQTATSESLATARKDLQNKLDAEKANNALLKAEYQQTIQDVHTAGGILSPFTDSLSAVGQMFGLAGGEITATRTKIEASDTAIAGFNKELEDNERAAKAGTVALNDLVAAEAKRADKLVQDATGQLQVTQQLAALQGQDVASLKKRKEDLLQANAQLRDAQNNLGAIPISPPGTTNPIEEQFFAWQKEIDNNKTLLTALDSLIPNQASLENANAAKKAYIDDLNQEYAAQSNLNAILKGDAAGAGSRVQDLIDQEQVLKNYQRELLQSGKDFNDAAGNLSEAGQQFQDNNKAIVAAERDLNDIRSAGPYLLLKAYQDLEKATADAYLQLQTQEAGFAQDLFDKNKAANDEYTKDVLKAAQDRDDALAKEKKKADDDEAEALKNHQDKLKQIGEQYADAIDDAIRGRNAAAAVSAIRAANKARRDEDKNYKDQQDKIEKARKDQNEEIEKNYQDQLKTIKDKLDEQVRANQEAYNKQVRDAEQAYRDEAAKRQQAYQDQIRALQSFLQNQTQLTSAQQANQLVSQFYFNASAQRLIDDFVNNALDSLSRLAAGYRNTTTGRVDTGGRGAMTVQTTVNVTTNADPNAIADAVAKRQTRVIANVARRLAVQQ